MENIKYCRLCGAELNSEGICPTGHEFNKMCLNCECCSIQEEGMVCTNEDNLNDAVAKITENINEGKFGYSVANIELKPLPLKKPTKNCKRWRLDSSIKAELENLFV